MSSQTTQVVPYVDSLPHYILSALRRVGLSRRKYQETACLETLRLFRDGKNAEINLPPGTGKTLISQIVGCIWIREIGESDSNKVLCVLPSSTLREQHFLYCDWWAGEAGLCNPLEIKSEWTRNRGVWHQKQAEQSDFWFALPGIFSNAVKSGHIPYNALKRVGLVILDEYDAFSIGVLRAEGYSLRFSKPSERLFCFLEQKERRYLLTSATPARVHGER